MPLRQPSRPAKEAEVRGAAHELVTAILGAPPRLCEIAAPFHSCRARFILIAYTDEAFAAASRTDSSQAIYVRRFISGSAEQCRLGAASLASPLVFAPTITRRRARGRGSRRLPFFPAHRSKRTASLMLGYDMLGACGSSLRGGAEMPITATACRRVSIRASRASHLLGQDYLCLSRRPLGHFMPLIRRTGSRLISGLSAICVSRI